MSDAWTDFCEIYDLLENATGDEEWLDHKATPEEQYEWEHTLFG